MPAQTPRRTTRDSLRNQATPNSVLSLQAYTPTTTAKSVTTLTWLGRPRATEVQKDKSVRTYYNAFDRLISYGGGNTPSRKKSKKQDEISRFTVGDGVHIITEAGLAVGVIIALWEEEDAEKDGDESGDESEEEEGTRMRARIHWASSEADLPSEMRTDLKTRENEVFIQYSSGPKKCSVTEDIPLSAIHANIPILSRDTFLHQYADDFQEKSKGGWGGWDVHVEGVYWCERALDSLGAGSPCYSFDIDEWRGNGKQSGDWGIHDLSLIPRTAKTGHSVKTKKAKVVVESGDEGESDGSGDDFKAQSEDEGEDVEEDEGDAEEELGALPSKRRKVAKPKPTKKPRAAPVKRTKSISAPKAVKSKRKVHPQTSASALPSETMDIEKLPVDPFERALRLLHVGATPDSLPCREEEFVDVLSKVEEGVESGGGGCLYIAGTPGTGKTATVHAVVKELRRKAQDGEIPAFSYVEINGLKIPSPQHAYTVLWEAISGSQGTSAKTALRGLEGHFSKKSGFARGPRGHTIVVLMDELDQLLTSKQDVVYNFFNWPTMRDSRLYVIAVANRMDLPQQLAAKIKSRLGLQSIMFETYKKDHLISIVQSRLVPHPKAPSQDPKVLLPDAIALAATKMAGTNGDARRVLDACRRAVEIAIENGKNPQASVSGAPPKPPGPQPVTSRQMNAVLIIMSSSPTAKFIQACSLQQKVMLAAVVRCVMRQGLSEVSWKSVKDDHDALTRNLLADTTTGEAGVAADAALLSNAELAIVLSGLTSSHALLCSTDLSKGLDERKIALGMEVREVGTALTNEGDDWRRVMAGV
ncbi:hypothetical protein L202_04304 [Cryptococcus amylolentus CBS 6039]|uniref:Origin recognition complex subunit 1 n=1 Tax=Cryptococcus amylolentus CBS 6039 TaxID=1295533 RepID=A0A1E3HTF6_9TREE|nr:hypothetical protein L202_04304 [Cryptococcus amylolentus CBS 6039]ODN78741.1 hypothetical protein L202_04304 [Cryptococcus amylolentus CBS 6039]